MLRKSAALTLILGLVALSAATYSTETPVRTIPATETCPEKCICLAVENGSMLEVTCPTAETLNLIEGAPPQDVDPSDVMDVEDFVGENKDQPDGLKLDEEAPLVEDNSVTGAETVSTEVNTPASVIDDDFTLVKKSGEDLDYMGDEPVQDDDLESEEDKEDNPPEVQASTPGVVPEDIIVVSTPATTFDDYSADEGESSSGNGTETEVAKEQPSELFLDEIATAIPTVAAVEEKASAATPGDLVLSPLSEEASPIPTAQPEEEIAAPSPSPAESEVTASVAPVVEAVAATLSPEIVAAVDSEESEEEVVTTATPTELPISAFKDDFSLLRSAPSGGKGNKTDSEESAESEEKVAEAASPEPSSPIPRVLGDLDNNLEETLTSEDLVLGPDAELSGKIRVDDETPAVSEAPQQSTASWVILGLILAMFVGVLLYAAIKGRLENNQHEMMPKITAVTSAVAAAPSEFAKNRRPSDEGTELKEMSRALLSASPLEDRCSRFIDEDDDQIRRILQQQEEDEILEQVVVDEQDLEPVNNAVEKPPRRFIHVAPPMVPEREKSAPSTPTLVHIKVGETPQVYNVANGNQPTTTSFDA